MDNRRVFIPLISLLFGLILLGMGHKHSVQLKPLELETIHKKTDSQIFKFNKNEVVIDGSYIKSLSYGGGKCVLVYLNKTTRIIKPKFTINIYNKYGLKLARCSDTWIFDSIIPGQNRVDELTADQVTDYNEVFKFSDIEINKDIHEVFIAEYIKLCFDC